MEARKVLVKENDEALIACPCCNITKKLSVEIYKQNSKRDLRIKCCCGNVFCLCLEYRKNYRKTVKLLGKSTNLSNHRESQDIIIKNISLGGVGFCPFAEHKIRQNDRLQVSFLLNDFNNTNINTDVTVRTVDNDYVGCEFNNTRKIKEEIGFYFLA
ncbi:MAG: PilZ domain-containing protein [Deltaproteobacteria bacterium]|jgi:hypothetical protein|nr:PilZ domain-containing protein [Deltaproteobacteria bacterium]